MSHTRVTLGDHPHIQRTRRHQTHRETVMRANDGVCHICGKGGADTIDHIVAVAWGGSDDITNLAPAHTSCNSRKRDAKPATWTHTRPSMWLPGMCPNGKKARKPISFGRAFGIVLLALFLFPLVLGLIVSAIGLSHAQSLPQTPINIATVAPAAVVEESPYFLDSPKGVALMADTRSAWADLSRAEKKAACTAAASHKPGAFARAVGLPAASIKTWMWAEREGWNLHGPIEQQYCPYS
ncbi:MAG: HNH endonuclease [Ilumatobacteraceae bacterium]